MGWRIVSLINWAGEYCVLKWKPLATALQFTQTSISFPSGAVHKNIKYVKKCTQRQKWQSGKILLSILTNAAILNIGQILSKLPNSKETPKLSW